MHNPTCLPSACSYIVSAGILVTDEDGFAHVDDNPDPRDSARRIMVSLPE
jgi:hypothetical protein